MGKSLVSCFFDSRCRLYNAYTIQWLSCFHPLHIWGPEAICLRAVRPYVRASVLFRYFDSIKVGVSQLLSAGRSSSWYNFGKIIKIVATRCHILKLKCAKFDFGWGSASDRARGACSALPDPVAGFKGPTSKEKDAREKEGEKRAYGEGKERGKGRGSGEGRGRHSLARTIAKSMRGHCCSIRPDLVLIRPWLRCIL